MRTLAVDPRAWNIVAGLCVANACGSRVIGADTAGSETSESNTTLETSDSTTEAPECMTGADCPYGYYCYEGVCEYVPHHDGHLDYSEYSYGDCEIDTDCEMLELCEFSYCGPVPTPSSCRVPDVAQGIPVVALGLSFADVDDDGAQELVVATQSELQVYESGSDIPLVSLREPGSDSIDAMVAGQFDATAGEDVVILFADGLYQHGSDGMGNFAAAVVSPTYWPDSVGLLAGDFDGLDPADLLIWASSGAGLELGSGSALEASLNSIKSATARSLADPVAGFVLQHEQFLDFYTAAGTVIGSAEMRADDPHALTSIAELGDGFDLSSSVIASPTPWTLIEEWGPATGNLGARWGLPGQVTAMAGGDFDGDGRADVALLVGPTVQIQFGVRNNAGCLAVYPFAAIATSIAVGDHDGDGDDELAIRFEDGHVVVSDHQ